MMPTKTSLTICQGNSRRLTRETNSVSIVNHNNGHLDRKNSNMERQLTIQIKRLSSAQPATRGAPHPIG